jgi:hypothetical protein
MVVHPEARLHRASVLIFSDAVLINQDTDTQAKLENQQNHGCESSYRISLRLKQICLF